MQNNVTCGLGAATKTYEKNGPEIVKNEHFQQQKLLLILFFNICVVVVFRPKDTVYQTINIPGQIVNSASNTS